MRSSDVRLSATTSDEISCGSSTQKFDEAYSKKNLLNENVTQQSPSNSMIGNEDYIHAEAILKSPLFSAYRKIVTWDPGETLQKPQNRDPSGTLEKLEKQEPGP